MEIQTLLARLRMSIFVGMAIVLIGEAIFSVLSTQRIMALSSLEWMLLRDSVSFGTGVVCVLAIARLSTRRAYLRAYWCSVLVGILSIVFFFLSYILWTVLPDIVWAVLSYCGALVSSVALLSAEYMLTKRRKPLRTLQQKKMERSRSGRAKPYPPLAYKVQRNHLGQEQAIPAQQEVAPKIFRRSRKVEVSSLCGLPTILILHCHKDHLWGGKCRDQLEVLDVQGVVALWDENKIPPGSIRQDEMERALAAAKVVVLLVSARFLSECFTLLQSVLRCQKNRKHFWICPVVVSPCPYDKSLLRRFQPYWSPTNTAKEPLHKLCLAKQNESFCDLAGFIASQLDLLACNRTKPTDRPFHEDNGTLLMRERTVLNSSTGSCQNLALVDSREETMSFLSCGECPCQQSTDNGDSKVLSCITEEDKMSFLRVKAILEKEGLPNHTFHVQYNNGEYLRNLQQIIAYPNPQQELVDWVRDAMKIIIEDDNRVYSQSNRKEASV